MAEPWPAAGAGLSARDDDRPPICPTCGVTMVAADLSATRPDAADWVCIECEEQRSEDET